MSLILYLFLQQYTEFFNYLNILFQYFLLKELYAFENLSHFFFFFK